MFAKVGGVDNAAGIESSVLNCCKSELTYAASAVEAYSVAAKVKASDLLYSLLLF
jgi:hypothetical protein